MATKKTAVLLYCALFFTLHPMEENSDDWVIVSSGIPIAHNVQFQFITKVNQELQNQNQWILAYAINHGLAKVIKRLSNPNDVQTNLEKAQIQFAIRHGKKYALEAAILKDYLNYVKHIIEQTDDLVFKAQAFSIAALNRKIKTIEYLVTANPTLFTTTNTIPILYKLIDKAIQEKSMKPIKIIFTSSLQMDAELWKAVIQYSIISATVYEFKKCENYLKKCESFLLQQEQNVTHNSNSSIVMFNTM